MDRDTPGEGTGVRDLPAALLFLVMWRPVKSADLVDRGHPPTTLGTWPSGGVARTVVVYGLVVYFALLALGVREVLTWTWATAATLGAVESWTRIYTLRHWLTDVVGGYVFGVALLILVMIAVGIVESGTDRRECRLRWPCVERTRKLQDQTHPPRLGGDRGHL